MGAWKALHSLGNRLDRAVAGVDRQMPQVMEHEDRAEK
jgi:hypothetical protein